MYVNRFLNNSSSGTVIDQSRTILGIPAKEDELLAFARDNNFKYLILYNLNKLWPYKTNPFPLNTSKTYEEILCDFIEKAKTQYCIEEIGVAGGSTDFFTNAYDWNMLAITPPYNFNLSESFTWPGPSSLNFVETQYTTSDKALALKAEIVKNYLYASDFNATCSQKLDVLMTEYEFWDDSCDPDGTLDDCPSEFEDLTNQTCSCDVAMQWSDYQDILNHCATIRANSQSTHPLLIDTYLGWFGADGTQNDQAQANFIDNIVDRVSLHVYRSSPSSMFGYIASRLQLFGSGSGSKPNTIIRPIISNEHPADEGNNFLGNWLDAINTPQNTVYSAEKIL
jgi:hypothetical protein